VIADVVAVAVFGEVTETEFVFVFVIPNSHLTTPSQHVNVKYWKELTSSPRRGWGRGGSDYIYWTRYFSVSSMQKPEVAVSCRAHVSFECPRPDC